jgi:hypothetical protein
MAPRAPAKGLVKPVCFQKRASPSWYEGDADSELTIRRVPIS